MESLEVRSEHGCKIEARGELYMYEQKLIGKSHVISTLLIGVVLLGIVGCGNDDEKLDKPIDKPDVKPAAPILTKEDVLGAWEVESINDLTPEAFLESPEGEDLEEISITLNTFHFVFSDDDSWKINLDFESILDFPDNPPDPELPPDGKLKIIGEWSGNYTIKDPKLILTPTAADITIKSEPEDYIQVATDGLTKEEAEADLDKIFRDDLLKPFKQSHVILQSDKRMLLGQAGKRMVLKPQ